jgi:serine/threonine protein kinase
MHIRFNFIHRDIKPENVLLTCPSLKVTAKKKEVWQHKDFAEACQIKLCDLGLSKPLQMEGTATQVGTANFICPEI